MKTLRILTAFLGILLAASEIARWWNDPRFLPLAFDELLVAAAMLGAAAFSRVGHAASLAAAWGIYTGLMLALFVPTLDHLFFGPEKDSANFYSVVLGVLLLAGVAGLTASLRLNQKYARYGGSL